MSSKRREEEGEGVGGPVMLNFKSCAPAKANVSTFKNSEFVSRIGGERNKEKEEREDETNEIRIPAFFPAIRSSILPPPFLSFFF